MRSINGWTPMTDVLWEAGYRSGVERRNLIGMLDELKIRHEMRDDIPGVRATLCVGENDAPPLADLLRDRRNQNTSMEHKIATMNAARAAKKPDATDRMRATKARNRKKREAAERMRALRAQRKAEKEHAARKAAVEAPSPARRETDKPQESEFAVTVRKLIRLCVQYKVDQLVIENGEAKIIRTKEETIK